MPRHRSHSLEFKRQVVEEYLGGETLHDLAKRHDISRQLIRVWIEKYEGGAFDDDTRAADLVQHTRHRSPPSNAWLASRRSSWSF